VNLARSNLAISNLAMSHAHMQTSIPLVVAYAMVTATALVYLRGWLSLRKAFPTLIPGWRLAAFMSGLLSVWAAVASPLATLDHRSLTIHMIKHLLLMTLAAPLLLAGAPVFPLVCGLPKLFIKTHPRFASPPARWFEKCLKNPVSCWLAGTAAVIGWHLPVAFDLGMRSQWVHSLEDFCFLIAGLLFWWPVVLSSPSARRSPRLSMALYLFLATLPCDILSAFLVFCNRLVYPFYLSTPQLFSLSPLEDQECAGALMWVWITFAYLIPAVIITMQVLSPSHFSPSTEQSQVAPQAARDGVAGRSLNGAEVL
jgi:putative membrane protein